MWSTSCSALKIVAWALAMTLLPPVAWAGQPPLRLRSIAVYADFVDGVHKWPATRQFPTFESFVDFVADQGINEIALSATSTMFLPMRYVDMAAIGYPEAVAESRAVVQQRRDTLDRHAAYCSAKGIRLLPGGYEHNVPAGFYAAHKEELNPGGRFTAAMSKHDGLDTARIDKYHVVGNVSWNRPLYRKFWIDAHRALLQALPHVDGLRQTYGEWAWSYEQATHAENVRDYLTTLWGLLHDAHGDQAVLELRDWYVAADELTGPALPPLTIVAKDSGHDAGPVELGPWLRDYVKAGRSVQGEVNLMGAENTRPLLWFDAEFIRQRLDGLRRAGAAGFNARTGPEGHFVTDLELRALGAMAARGQAFTAANAVAVLGRRFGAAAAPHVYRALERTGFVLREYTKLYCGRWPWWQSDGVSINVLHTGFRGFEGFLDPLDYIRGDAVSLPDYVAALQSPPAERARREAAWKQQGRAAPPEMCRRLREAGLAAKAAAVEAARLAPDSARNDAEHPLDELLSSAVIARHTGELFASYVELAVDYELSEGRAADEALRRDMAARLDATAVAWTVIGQVGQRWFPERLSTKYAEGCWRKYAQILHKKRGLDYAGPDPRKIVVDPELPRGGHGG